jgi:hypothetical protein
MSLLIRAYPLIMCSIVRRSSGSRGLSRCGLILAAMPQSREGQEQFLPNPIAVRRLRRSSAA